MGLLTILKKMKQKERELRLLMLYPPARRSREGSRGTRRESGARRPLPGVGCAAGRPVPTVRCASRTWVLPIAPGGGPGGGRTTGPGRVELSSQGAPCGCNGAAIGPGVPMQKGGGAQR